MRFPVLSFLEDVLPDASQLRQRDHALLPLADDEDVADTRSERVSLSVFEVHDVEATHVSLTLEDDADSATVLATHHHSQVATLELQYILQLVRFQIELDGVIDSNVWVRLTEGATVVSDHLRNCVVSQLCPLYLDQLLA